MGSDNEIGAMNYLEKGYYFGGVGVEVGDTDLHSRGNRLKGSSQDIEEPGTRSFQMVSGYWIDIRTVCRHWLPHQFNHWGSADLLEVENIDEGP